MTKTRFLLPSVFCLLCAIGASADTRLTEAVKAGDLKAVQALLAQRPDVNAQEADGSTALHWAAHRGDVAIVDALIRAGAKPRANRYGITPLALAAESGSAPVVDRLLKGGADPNIAASGGETVLMAAARAGRTEVVRILLEAGADPNAREATRGQTALMWAGGEGHADVVRLLIQHKADIKAVSHGPASDPDITRGDSAYLRIAPRVDVFTPLQFAVHGGQVEAARVLIDAGADTKVLTPQGMGLLTMAVANAHFDVAALLIERGADVNAAEIGWTPLHQLVRVRTLNIGWGPPPPERSGRLAALDVAELLLKHGADVDARTKKPWHDGYRGTFALNATPLLLAAKGGDAQMMQILAKHGADVKATNANGTTVLMAAAGAEMMNPNEDSGRDVDGFEAVKVAIALGAGDINAVNKGGDTALHGAMARVTPLIAKALVESGAKLDAKNGRGLMPFELAAGAGAGNGSSRPEIAAMLRDAMVARGLTPPEVKTDASRFAFGVKNADVNPGAAPKGAAAAPAPPSARSAAASVAANGGISGTWELRYKDQLATSTYMLCELAQDGARVGGTCDNPSRGRSAVSGSAAGSRLEMQIGGTMFTAAVDPSGKIIKGTLVNLGAEIRFEATKTE